MFVSLDYVLFFDLLPLSRESNMDFYFVINKYKI